MGTAVRVDERSKVYARGAQAIRMHRMRMYAFALKIASEQRATDFKPGISLSVAQWYSETARYRLRQNTPPPFAEPPLGAQDHSLIYRRVAVVGKERSAPVVN